MTDHRFYLQNSLLVYLQIFLEVLLDRIDIDLDNKLLRSRRVLPVLPIHKIATEVIDAADAFYTRYTISSISLIGLGHKFFIWYSQAIA